MIAATMALAAIESGHLELGDYAREARGTRLIALVVDTIFYSVIWSVANAVFGVAQITWGSPLPINGSTFYGTTTAVPWIWSSVLYVLYFAIPEAIVGWTPGKYLSGLRVVSVDARPLSVGRVLIRNILRPIDTLPVLYLIGGISVLASRRSQRLGDFAAGTTVVNRRRALQKGAGRGAGISLLSLAVGLILFTGFFDYFGRPGLVIEGQFNQHQLMNPEVVSYSLGQPTWSLGRVVYPIKANTPTARCTGWVELDWEGLGWQMGSGQLDCPPS
jgi:uncharacterized RDD family membrane protein YckC